MIRFIHVMDQLGNNNDSKVLYISHGFHDFNFCDIMHLILVFLVQWNILQGNQGHEDEAKA